MNCLSKGEKMQLDKDNKNWMGKLPESWNTRKIKYVLWQRNEDNLPIKSKKILSLTAKQGVIPYEEKVGGGNKPKQNFSAYKLAYPGDIVMNSMNILSGAVGLSKYKGCVSPVYYMLRPISKADDVRFFYYVFANKAFQHSLLGIGNGILIKKSDKGTYNTIRMRIPIEKLKNLVVPYPSAEEQRSIADFLDKKCADIDKLSTQIQKEIDTLQKYRKSVITNAVTKGLDDNVPMKDSGIDWIGKIPKAWNLGKLKFFVEIQSSKNTLENMDGRYIGLENVEKDNGNFVTSNSTYEPGIYDSCEKGDILYSKLRPNLAKVIIAPFDACCTGEFEVLKARNSKNKWIKYYLLSEGVTKMTTAATYGAKMPRVNWNFVSNLPLPVPSNNEIDRITDYLDGKISQIDKIISQKQKQLSLLSDYKNSLIFEYVTGKKQISSNRGEK